VHAYSDFGVCAIEGVLFFYIEANYDFQKIRNIELFVVLEGPKIYFHKISSVFILFQGTKSDVSQTYVKSLLFSIFYYYYAPRVSTVKYPHTVTYAD
jgi:hypothetical protein